MKKINSTIKVLIFGIVVGIVIVLIILIALFNANAISFSNKSKCKKEAPIEEKSTVKNTDEYSYDKLKGLYSYKKEGIDDEADQLVYNLYLYNNGTYVYKSSDGNGLGELGNYIVKDKYIRLNSLFSFNSDGGITSKFESKLLTIISSTEFKLNNISLLRNKKDEKEFAEKNDFIDAIDKNPITNKHATINMIK